MCQWFAILFQITFMPDLLYLERLEFNLLKSPLMQLFRIVDIASKKLCKPH